MEEHLDHRWSSAHPLPGWPPEHTQGARGRSSRLWTGNDVPLGWAGLRKGPLPRRFLVFQRRGATFSRKLPTNRIKTVEGPKRRAPKYPRKTEVTRLPFRTEAIGAPQIVRSAERRYRDNADVKRFLSYVTHKNSPTALASAAGSSLARRGK